ncbi:transcriptional activator ligand binding domain protein [Beutenbergia cavernae DSM 12333]|uniref:Transcriptional activator ligand binding domain protein n=1 Tax=Beutenbergia cavernae (strain ATCC BAA-8 / DSM 12333 / CCUG 43141 / JCM 11478 / NBRC 16432 / NCIMB 13614 / HKI 0122) TaxID=471853 RepID=C5C0X9_BEUC1|nr:GyrI-like domain-containing protein [Beutenbergia cavernae]ACQ79383.1 transcriptional activator ligand binding domain protein [Beutenbergia cavernae DSM 12333]
MTAEPAVVERPSRPYVGIAEHVGMTEVGRIGGRIAELFTWAGEHGLDVTGAPFFRYHVIDMAREMLVEAGIPVADDDATRAAVAVLPASAADDGAIAAGLLPAGRYTVVLHRGHPDSLVAATAALLAWGAEQGLRFDHHEEDDGDHWASRIETYLSDPAEVPDMADWETELAFRLAD